MGRRSDHNRDELKELILSTGAALITEVGLANFSARAVARRIGYSIGTIHNVFGSTERLIAAINTRSFVAWAAELRTALGAVGDGDRIAVLVAGYFAFARTHPHLWMAIYDHRLAALSDDDHAARGQLTEIVVAEVARALDRPADQRVNTLARSLIATVHGHCAFALGGAWALMGEEAADAQALARIRETLAVAQLTG